jgi:catechol 2,3-dioxygenase-like lactoylglutathione lyase family enzyme
VTLLVRDYDEAIAWFTQALGFELVTDTELGGGKRWVRGRTRRRAGHSASSGTSDHACAVAARR